MGLRDLYNPNTGVSYPNDRRNIMGVSNEVEIEESQIWILLHLQEVKELFRNINMRNIVYFLVFYSLCACSPVRERNTQLKNGNDNEWYYYNHTPHFPPFLIDINSSMGRQHEENYLYYEFPLLKKENFVYENPIKTVKILQKLGYKIKKTKMKKVEFVSWKNGGVLLFKIKDSKLIVNTPLYANAYCYTSKSNKTTKPIRYSEQCYVSDFELKKAGLRTSKNIKAR